MRGLACAAACLLPMSASMPWNKKYDTQENRSRGRKEATARPMGPQNGASARDACRTMSSSPPRPQ